jgi:serine/threonine-protein kinase
MGELILTETHDSILGGRYQILQRIGTGGMAGVSKARDLSLQRDVAIKFLRSDLTSDPSFRSSFLKEARSAANLSHPNIVIIHDFGEDSGQFFIVMEYVAGTDLKTLVRRRGRLGVQEATRIVMQICAGVGYAHRAGLIHCDIKPHNILVSENGDAKITDFGISRALSTIHPDEQSDIVWGSPQYFSPEQAAGAAPSPASDVYSIGVVFYEAITGRLPFETTDPTLLAELHQIASPTPAKTLNPSIPEPINNVLLKVLAKEPTGRYRTADQMGLVLQSILQEPEGAESSDTAAYPEEQVVDNQAPTTRMWFPSADRVDWLAVALSLLAVIAVGGLIPLWLYIWLLYNQIP